MRRPGIILMLCGALFLAGAAAWSTMAVSSLVKFPLTTNTTLQYTGHFVTFVNARTGATLARPSSVPLVLDRTVKAVPAESNASTAIVDEDIVLHYSGNAVHEDNVYAINRTSMCNIPSARACTFARGNPYPAAGSYYVTLPMNLTAGQKGLRIWKPETGTTYPLVPLRSGAQPSTLDGLKVLWFSGTLPITPVAPYERTSLAARGLPMTISPASIEAKLSADGISVPTLTKALTPLLSAAQLRAVGAVLSTPVALNYYAFGTGLVAAEPRTGAIIDLRNVIDGIAVAPATGGLHTLISIMAKHTTVAGVPAALAVLRRLAVAPPQPVYELQYNQAPASVAGMVNTAKSQLRQIAIVTYYIPIAMVVIGLALIAAGFTRRTRRHHRMAPAGTPATGQHVSGGAVVADAGRRAA
ncbi:MAG: porin PorA family protein [Acidimicrobiales bacterium]